MLPLPAAVSSSIGKYAYYCVHMHAHTRTHTRTRTHTHTHTHTQTNTYYTHKFTHTLQYTILANIPYYIHYTPCTAVTVSATSGTLVTVAGVSDGGGDGEGV